MNVSDFDKIVNTSIRINSRLVSFVNEPRLIKCIYLPYLICDTIEVLIHL
jgi:hypothetical protein